MDRGATMWVDGGSLAETVELNPAPCLLVDGEGVIVVANDAFHGLTDLRPADVAGMPIDEIVRRDTPEVAVRTGGRSWLPVKVLERRVGDLLSWRLMTFAAVPMPSFEALSEMKRLIEALLDPTFLLEPVFDGDRIVDLAMSAGNTHLERLIGAPLEAVLGQGIREMSQEDAESRRSFERYVEVAHTGEPSAFTLPWRRAGQLLATFEVSAQRVGGRVMVTFRDRTEGDQARAALHAAGRRIQALDEERRGLLRAKRDFLTMAAHELRTPVTTVLGFAELLGRGDDLADDERRSVLEALLRSARRQSRIVSSLVEASRLEGEGLTVTRTAMHLGTAIGDALAALGIEVEGRVIVECPDDLTLMSDPDRVEQILTSFLSNAVKYGAGSLITVRVEATADEVCVTVADQGPGVPEAFVPQLFEMFTQAGHARRRTARGVGLGLHLANAVARALGGRIEYARVDPSGAAFSLRLPR